MKYSDVGVVVVMYAVCAFFYAMTLDLPPEAQIYPLSLLAGLALLNTLFLAQKLLALGREGLGNDLPRVFDGFMSRQFFVVLACCVGYLVLMHLVGFYAAGVAYLVGVMLFLRVPRLHIGLTVGVMALLIYVVFTLFLKVPLPRGILFGG